MGIRKILTACIACMTATVWSLSGKEAPRIVNIINFIRQTEPRSEEITDEVLYRTVESQAELMARYGLKGTFLLQYDALINPDYQSLMKQEEARGCEVGGWWEITEPHVKAAGIEWRGRYPWDWHADVGFATGYSPEEREKLVDVYMEKFRSVFGYYPSSVGSWFIDAHTLGYMHDRYGITASCNCKDQVGTDGYTLWGGYWNQAYYPSRLNAYMPAQTEEGQIPVPVFRMLGSDPIYQYDTGLGHTVQGVITLEPVYPDAGGDARWVRRFLKGVVEDPCIGFNYTQAGQENSFTWDGMGRGLEMQFPILDSLRAGGAVRIETLKESASWFKKRYKVTPPTSFSALTDTYGNGNATLWFNSRYYRANILWNKDGIRFRDIHLFDERIKSDYLEERGTSNQCIYTTCPIVDGFLWSTRESYAAARFFHSTEGAEKEIIPEDVEVTSSGARGIRLAFRSSEGEKFAIVLDEKGISIEGPATGWYMKICLPDTGKVSLSATGGKTLGGEMKGIRYGVRCIKGDLASAQGEFVFSPEKGEISIDCSDRTSI